MADRLLLFDIDGTLVSTRGAGIRAMEAAGRSLFGPLFSINVDTAGRLDPGIMLDVLTANGVEGTRENLASFRAAYAEHLSDALQPNAGAWALPGVLKLVEELAAIEGVTLGLLTGNFPETGEIKVRRIGLQFELFVVSAWGSDSPNTPPRREDLPPVAMGRFQERFEREIEARSVTIIGDTPHDIACARAHGCRCLAVATGRFRIDELEVLGPDRAMPELSETSKVVDWLMDDRS